MLATPFAGFLADRWTRVNRIARSWLQLAGLALLIPSMILLSQASALPATICALALYGAGQGTWNVGNMPILCDVVAPAHRSTAYGLVNLTGTVGGGLAVLLFGALSRVYGAPAMFGALALMVAFSLGLAFLNAARFHAADLNPAFGDEK